MSAVKLREEGKKTKQNRNPKKSKKKYGEKGQKDIKKGP